jgi:hypothetical protein
MIWTADGSAWVLGGATKATHSCVLPGYQTDSPSSYSLGDCNTLQEYKPDTDSWRIAAGDVRQGPGYTPACSGPTFTNVADDPPGVGYVMESIPRRGDDWGIAGDFEDNGYYISYSLNGVGIIKWDTETESLSLFTDWDIGTPGRPDRATGDIV